MPANLKDRVESIDSTTSANVIVLLFPGGHHFSDQRKVLV
jgi:hypothetical protein